MQEKFKKVIEEYSKYYVVIGDDQLIHNILEKCNIEMDDLPDLAIYLAEEFERTSQEEDMDQNDKVEQLQYGVNFIFEARNEGYKVFFKSKYIEQVV
ncbi:hypothetical protein ABER99_21775 [Paenibacillus glucanolyticus]|uniref:Uncharacterized protein n=1 Tax=Paenibacillus glucanolyticus TaxID=59843 RepID=A0A163GQN9_9BACL|nr:hypothetical protein [Paenibacillus glucanolyticus]KZS45095.1 hypothetical protein AWU65_03695 [Paenibacillus glucanolyticus]OMF65484.1 hypothetical protein BK142_30800 [Paenibacillus glucanolyticus]